ncbi:MAG: single-stranded-DNA-specific exonuclease RecJ [Eubacteriales bacterium]|nr:single-stranded-DNA-specific exonuclease RecJ [Eubacteriales bacterium]
MSNRQWILKEKNSAEVQRLMDKYNISKICASVLSNRKQVLEGDSIGSNSFYDSFLIKDMNLAVDRIKSAIATKEKITIYGDFDADGVTSTTILYMYLKDCGADVEYYIPDRMEEGYGINETALQTIQQNGTTLIITVDTGITAVEDINAVKQHGIDVIVTDHHEPKDVIPDCVAVIDPKREDCEYPYKELAGVGVVFKLIQALDNGEHAVEIIKKFLPFVCLGTIADVAPLTDENRLLVKSGLQIFHKSENYGIQALLRSTGFDNRKVTAGNIGFVIAPRINASGRLGSAKKGVELFLCDDPAKADEIATDLANENKNRQKMEQEIYSQALKIIEENKLNENKVIVVASKGWHQGIIGIVSSKITEKYYKPSILITINENGVCKGSGRSISSFSLFEALSHASPLLQKFGGHSLAAGLTVEEDKIDEFSMAINAYADSVMHDNDFTPQIFIDDVLYSENLNTDTVSQLKLLEPFGMGNPVPVFMVEKAKIKLINISYDKKHLRLQLVKNGMYLDVIGFNMASYYEQLKQKMIVDVVGTISINEYAGITKLQLLLKDIRPHQF